MTYPDILSYLKENDFTMARYERDHYDAFLKESGLSIHFPYIHIAGSNGKGSTARYLAAIYKEAGYSVASYLSPWLHEAKEGILFEQKHIKEEEFARIFDSYFALFQKYHLSSFEISTAIMVSYFNEKKPDIAIIECGMGGKIDATNIPSSAPVLSLISSVSLEHTSFLGKDSRSIAFQKSGIFRPNVPALIGQMDEEAKKACEEVASFLPCSLHFPSSITDFAIEGVYSSFSLNNQDKRYMIASPARSLAMDAALAIKAVELLQNRFPVRESAVRNGLMVSPLPARFHLEGRYLFDGAHNEEAISSLVSSIKEYTKGKRVSVLFASLKDKKIEKEFPLLEEIAAKIICTTFSNKRARKREDYVSFPYEFIDNPKDALEKLEKGNSSLIVITGSLAFAWMMEEEVSKK